MKITISSITLLQIFPRQRDAEFNEEGRPFHPFFYTTFPTFGQTMYEVVDHIENLTFFSDRMSKQNKSPDPTLVISDAALSTTRWMTKDELSTLFFEQITERQVPLFHYYKSFVPTLQFDPR